MGRISLLLSLLSDMLVLPEQFRSKKMEVMSRARSYLFGGWKIMKVSEPMYFYQSLGNLFLFFFFFLTREHHYFSNISQLFFLFFLSLSHSFCSFNGKLKGAFFSIYKTIHSRESSKINEILDSIFLFYNRQRYTALLVNFPQWLLNHSLSIRPFKINKQLWTAAGRKIILCGT